MPEFTPIATQEEFDARLKERLARERETVAKKYEGFISKADHDAAVAGYEKQISDLNTKCAGTDKTIADLNAQVKNYETATVKARVAHEVGLPYGMAARLSGETEEEITKDAEALKGIIGQVAPKAPPAATEPGGTSTVDTAAMKQKAAYKKLLNSLNNKGE